MTDMDYLGPLVRDLATLARTAERADKRLAAGIACNAEAIHDQQREIEAIRAQLRQLNADFRRHEQLPNH